jgi:hypothetical protein
MSRRTINCFALSALMVVAAAAACDQPETRIPTSPSAPSLSGIEIVGPASVAPGGTTQLTARVRLDDGRLKTGSRATDIRWRSSDTSVMTVSSTGLVTAVAKQGDANVVAELPVGTGSRMATKEVVVLPEGTFRLVGQVRRQGASTPVLIPGARVEVTSGAAVAITNDEGRYRLYGVPPIADVRVSAEGYDTQTFHVELAGNATRDFALSLTADSPPPVAFRKLSPSSGSGGLSGAVTLLWEAVTGANFFVCWDTTNNGRCDTTWSTNGGATSRMLSGLAPGTYYWQVRAEASSSAAEADNGTWWSYTVGAGTPPPFGKLSPSPGSIGVSTDVELRWMPVTGVSFRVCLDTTNNGSCDATWWTNGSGTSRTAAGLTPGTYYWQVRADSSTSSTEADSGAWWSFTVVPIPSLAGNYTLLIDVVGSCTGFSTPLPTVLQHRSYDAVVTQSGSDLDVLLTSPQFRVSYGGRGNHFGGVVTSGGASFDLGTFDLAYYWAYYNYYAESYPSVVERLSSGGFLVLEGSVDTTRSAAAGLSGTTTSLALLQFDSTFPALTSSVLAGCSGTHTFRMIPR